MNKTKLNGHDYEGLSETQMGAIVHALKCAMNGMSYDKYEAKKRKQHRRPIDWETWFLLTKAIDEEEFGAYCRFMEKEARA